jgi:hypothetical protein
VLFPAMAAASPERVAALYRTGTKAVLIAVFPLALVATVFAAEWMHAWLGAAFAERATLVAQLLCVGAAVNCLAYLPFTLLQARGRADLPAKAHWPNCRSTSSCCGWRSRAGESTARRWPGFCVAPWMRWFSFALANGNVRSVSPHPRSRPSPSRSPCWRRHAAGRDRDQGASTRLRPRIFLRAGWLVLLDAGERARARHPRALLSGDLSQ